MRGGELLISSRRRLALPTRIVLVMVANAEPAESRTITLAVRRHRL
jgi:hypothetical protein